MSDTINKNAISRKEAIKKETLNPNQYTISLLQKAYKLGFVDKGIMERINIETLSILKELIVGFTKGESSSVSIDTGEKLLISIYYSLDAYAVSFDYPEDFIELLKLRSVNEVYQKGVTIVAECVKEAEVLLRAILKDKLEVPLQAYNLTIQEDLPAFFAKYEVMFGAQDTVSGIDYPLVFDDMRVRGVYYIKNYLETLQTETLFCRCFSKEDHLLALTAFGKLNGIDYTKIPLNLFEIIINNSMFSVLSGSEACKLLMSKTQLEILINRLCAIEPSKVGVLIDDAAVTMIDELGISNPKVIDYIKKYNILFTKSLVNAIKNDSIRNVVLIEDEQKTVYTGVVFEAGERMSTSEFEILMESIEECENIEQRISIIANNIGSLHDFIDILECDFLYGDEFITLYNRLGDLELTALGLTIFYEELRNKELNIGDVCEVDFEKEWQVKYLEYIKGLEENRRKSLEQCINGTRLSHDLGVDYRLGR